MEQLPIRRVTAGHRGRLHLGSVASLQSRREAFRQSTTPEAKMRIHLFSAGLLLLGAGVGTAVADEVVVIQPQQETVIREYVKKKPLASIALPGIELNVGTGLPDTVELHKLEVPDVSYEYVVIDNRTVLVDPGTRKIIRVLD
jgi:hypothetical protein